MAEVILPNGGIYCIKNTKNGKCYVGSAVSFKVRWKLHRTQLRAGIHHSSKLQNSWNKHGEQMFEFIVLEKLTDPESLVPREQCWMDKLNAHKGGYNTSPTAGSVLGIKHSEEMREKMRAIRAANPITPEQQEKMAEARRNSKKFMSAISALGASRKGFKHTPEALAKIAAASKARMADPTQRELQRRNSLGRKHTPEAIQKMRDAQVGHVGRKQTPEAIEKIRAAGIGRRVSEETIQRRIETRKRNAELKKQQAA